MTDAERLEMLKLGQFRQEWLAEAEAYFERWRLRGGEDKVLDPIASLWALRCRELLQQMRQHAGVVEE